MTAPRTFRYESMGTHWGVSLWDDVSDDLWTELQTTITTQSAEFDATFSRFKKTSLIWSLTKQQGIVEVPHDLVAMLRLYERLFDLSGGKLNPLVGFALSDLGYDADYSLKTKDTVRPVPDLHAALAIVDDTHLELRDSVLIDLGALGKGYFADTITAILRARGCKRFLVDGSGDIYYSGDGQAIRAGLEHPGDPTKVIGVVEMEQGAMCSSANNRRRWGKYAHTIDPQSLSSPEDILATWVLAETAALADGLATCLFLAPPENFASLTFDYCLLNAEYRVKRSAGFRAELY